MTKERIKNVTKRNMDLYRYNLLRRMVTISKNYEIPTD